MLSKVELEKLRLELPRDKTTRIKKLFLKKYKKEVTTSSIRRALTGESQRLDILIVAARVLKNYKNELNEIKKQLS